MMMPRRSFLQAAAGAGYWGTGLAAGDAGLAMSKAAIPPIDPTDPASWRAHFPALAQSINGHPLVYLDTAATSLRPAQVIAALGAFYSGPNANPSAALHTLARRAAKAYDDARRMVVRFVGRDDPLELVFTRGTSEAINLVATAWGGAHLKPDDEILLTEAEHASNMLPWQLIAARTGATVRYSAVTDDGHIDLADFTRQLSRRTRIAAFSHVSNVAGIVNPVGEMCSAAHAAGALALVDAAQSAPHLRIDVSEIGCDFLAFSSHKMCGPMGAGALWATRALLDAMPPYQSGSNMAHGASRDSWHYADGGLKFGAGTPNVADAIGFAAAVDFLGAIGWTALRAHEEEITRQMLTGLGRVPGLHLLGSNNAAEKVGVFAFTLDGWKPNDVVADLDTQGIAVRAGDLAALPLLTRLGTTAAVRASCYLYTTADDVDHLLRSLARLARH